MPPFRILPRRVFSDFSTTLHAVTHITIGIASRRATWCGLAAAAAIAFPALPSYADTHDTSLAEGVLLNIVSLASARLAEARPVAQWKWQNKLPIEDPAREQVLLDGLMKLAPEYGLEPVAPARAFFEDQMTASKQLQNALFTQWRNGPPPPPPAQDALASARSEIDRLSQAMLTALARVEPIRARDDCPLLLSQAVRQWTTQMTELDSAQKQALTVALRHVCANGETGGTA